MMQIFKISSIIQKNINNKIFENSRCLAWEYSLYEFEINNLGYIKQ